MTPIKVGEYTVESTVGKFIEGDREVFVVVDEDGVARGCIVQKHRHGYYRSAFDALPMALRHAAELAGIERQRVEWDPDEPGFSTFHPSDQGQDAGICVAKRYPRADGDAFRWLVDLAHEYARARYAAHGGAA
jgi:hypothetical protein